MNWSRFHPNAARISVNDQCGTGMISNRPARLSVRPLCTSSGDEPSSTTLSGNRAWVSASHRSFTAPNQQSPSGGFSGFEPGQIPLLLQPSPLAQSWLVGGGVVGGHPDRLHHLPGERGLANLARAGQDLEESPRLFHPPQQGVLKFPGLKARGFSRVLHQ
ncbi:MAG: hypothetical protein WCQ21_30450, partial [Verrucomicrobiota bacterium]